MSLKLYLCISCENEEHDECYGCDCGDIGHKGSDQAID